MAMKPLMDGSSTSSAGAEGRTAAGQAGSTSNGSITDESGTDGRQAAAAAAAAAAQSSKMWLQFKALLAKNWKTVIRNREQLGGEIFNTCLYIALLVGFSFTTQYTDSAARAYSAAPTTFVPGDTIKDSGYSSLCFSASGYEPCAVVFGDLPDGNGCSAELSDFWGALPLCRGTPFAPTCSCATQTQFADPQFVAENNVSAAVEFSPGSLTGDGTQQVSYTLHMREPQIAVDTIRFGSPRARVGLGAAFASHALGLQVAIDSAITDVEVAVLVMPFPELGFTTWEAGALLNLPFYLVMMFVFSLMAIVPTIAEENEKGTRQGLMMIGLSPFVYWAAWMLTVLLRLSLAMLYITVLVKVLILKQISVVALLTCCLPMVLWLMLLAACMGIVGLKPKAATNVAIWVPMLAGGLSYIYVSVTTNIVAGVESTEPLPSWVTLVGAWLFPPFAFTLQVINMMVFENPVEAGFGFEHFNTRTAIGASPMQVLWAQLFGVLPIFAFFYWRNVLTRGIAKAVGGKEKGGETTWVEGHGSVAVSIRSLEKKFGTVRAVDGLTVDFMSDEITAFLGHNGAGKSTTIGILTGAYSATRGDALICGHSIVDDMRSVRPIIGVCAQTNVLWDLLSVQEHVCLFATIRGRPLQPGDPEVTVLLGAVGLLSKKDSMSKALSGGMKRKLCFACALIGDPKVVFLDEPTAGMDAQSRRDVWALLMQKRKGRCIVLCTHYMDEADILGDRIAVVHAGKLQACGTPTELKTKHGKGLHLTATVTATAVRHDILRLLEQAGAKDVRVDVSDVSDDHEVAQAAVEKILSRSAAEDLRLTIDDKSDVPRLLAQLGRAKLSSAQTGLSDFGLVATTMDDIFWELDQEAGRTDEAAEALPAPAWEALLRPTTVPSTCVKMRAILGRRTRAFFRDWGQLLIQLLNVVLLVLGAVAASTDLISIFPSTVSPSLVDLAATAAFDGVPRMGIAYDTTPGSGSGDADTLVPQMQTWGDSEPTVPLAVNGAAMPPCINSWLIGLMDPTTCARNLTAEDPLGEPVAYPQTPGGFAGVVEFTTFPNGSTTVMPDHAYIVSPNNSVLLSLPAIVSLTNNAIRAVANGTSSSSSIAASFKSLPPTPKAPEELLIERMVTAQISSAIGGMLLVMGLNFVMASFAESVAEDKHKCVKQLQVLMGVTVIEYWAAQFLWDLAVYYLTLAVPVVYIFAAQGYLAHGAVILLLAVFPFAMLPLTYHIARLFERGSTAKILITGAGMLLFMLTFMLYFALAILKVNIDLLNVLHIVFCAFPPTALAMGMRAVVLSDAYGYSPLIISPPDPVYDIGFPVESAFVPLVALLANALLFSTTLVWAETRVQRSGACGRCCSQLKNLIFRCACCGCCFVDRKTKKPYPKPGRLTQEEAEDDDVRSERAACDTDLQTSCQPACPVHLHHVRKQYPPASNAERWLSDGLVAVNDACLRLRERECFALLGQNGAGKTTVLQVIMRQIEATDGLCYVQGQLRASGAAQRGFGYCPQANALFDTLTAREMLLFYTVIRGIPPTEAPDYTEGWLRATRLAGYAETRCGNLSGGNKRKLSLAIAVMGNPSLVVLDEPSAGVDPAARKKLHHVINGVKRSGATVVLTTHHMSEAAALGSRIGIMLHGHLACIGTPQHLLARYSEGYELSVCMASGGSVETEVLPMLRRLCPQHTVVDQPDAQFCKVALGEQSSFPLPELYAALEDLKRSQAVEFFSCGQANLESVFLRFTAVAETKEREAEERAAEERADTAGS